MRKEKLIIDFLNSRRLGCQQDYSVPAVTTFHRLNRPYSGRLVDASDEGCHITGM
jgi:hypothetical protein